MANHKSKDEQTVSCNEIDSTEKDNFFKPDSHNDPNNSIIGSSSVKMIASRDHEEHDAKKKRPSLDPEYDIYTIPSPSNTSNNHHHTTTTTTTTTEASESASPPRFIALEGIMKAANGVYKMSLAHEIAMDREFKLQKKEPLPNTLHKQVDGMMRKVFWDLLQNELDESPPNYKRALMLLEEIKNSLTSFLLPQHTRLKQEIDEILDLDLIKRQAENGALDFQRYAHYILSVMARLCAPVRDEKIQVLTQTREVVPMFRGIMELLDEMRIDMANFLVMQIRPQIMQQSVPYERKKFEEFLENKKKLSHLDGLESTKKWLKRNYDCNEFSGESKKEIINRVLTTAYIELLQWDDSLQERLPETLLLDEKRILTLRDALMLNVLVGSSLLIAVNTFSSLQSLAELKEEIRDHLMVIIGDDSDGKEDLSNKLKSAALQIIKDVSKFFQNHGYAKIDPSKEELLKNQIIDIENKNNRIRQLVQRRILEFVESVFTSNTASPVQMPKGLTALQQNLSSLAGQFTRIASHNRAVYGDYYVDIITDIIEKKL
ncbi:T-complex protein 11-like protein 1 [Brevipalpus obovatus]|uniref:T-complex protein 11-like protein 1 n=1 Tax=Brevipalpus obovatus TaxID=246614 RepID=UPI003D9DB773